MILCGVHGRSPQTHVGMCIICVCAACSYAQHRFKGGYVRGALAIDEIHRSREEKARLEGGGRRRVCRACTPGARTVRIMHRPRMQSACGTNLALECLRMDGIASLLLFLLPRHTRASRRCLMHVCTRYSKILAPEYKAPGAAPAANAHELTSHEEVSFLSLSLFYHAPSVSLLPGNRLRFSLFGLALSSHSGFLLSSPLTVHYSSHSSWRYTTYVGTHTILFEPFA